jgi:hypothetical protein
MRPAGRDEEMPDYHLAQLNIARMKYPMDADDMSGFVARLEDINALADRSPGFVWRLQTEDGDATAIDFFGTDYLVNLSVWEDVDSLHAYVYRSAHAEVMARRHDWFERIVEAYLVLWWVPAGHIPGLEEAGERLEQLRRDGPGPSAFTLKQRFDPA